MSILPILPLLILLAGTGLLLLGLNPNFRQSWLVALLTATAATLVLLATAFSLPLSATLSAWAPVALFRVGLRVQVDPLAWLFGMGICLTALAALLTGLARPGGRRLTVRGAILLLTAAGLAAVFADNLPTRLMAWAGLDLLYFLALLLLARAEGMELQAVLNLAFNSLGTLLALGAAVLIARTSASLSLRDAALSPQSTVLITLAAVFRLGLFPLHLGLPAEANIRQGLGTMLRLVPAAVALEVVARLAVFGFAEPVRPWLTLFAVAAALVGAVQLWNVAEPRQGLTYLIIAQSGLALLAGLWAGAQAVPAVAAQSLALVLGAGLLYLSHGGGAQRPLALVPPLLGAATLLGLPLTIGLTGIGGLYAGLMDSGNWFVLAGVAAAEVILAAGLWRTALWPGEADEEVDALSSTLSGAGLALVGVTVILLGLFAGAMSVALGAPARPLNLAATGLGLAALALGFGAVRYEGVVRSVTSIGGAPLAALARIDWLYRLVWGVIHLAANLIASLAAVLEGEGALLWTIVAVLLIYLTLR